MPCPECKSLPVTTTWRHSGDLLYPLHGCGNDLTCEIGKRFRNSGGTVYGSLYSSETISDIPGRDE